MENEINAVGQYISGIAKRPDLVNKPCVLVCKEEGFTLSVLVEERAESFDFPYTSVDNVTVNTRLLVSQNTGLEREDTSVYENLLAFALFGMKGYALSKTAELSNLAFRNTIGKMDFSNKRELIVEYHTDTENRRLFMYASNNPRELIEYFNSIKK